MPVILPKKKKKKEESLLLSVDEVSFWSISVAEGIPQRHQGYQTQHQAQIWACTSAELRGGTRPLKCLASTLGFIHKTRSATVHRNIASVLRRSVSGLYGCIFARLIRSDNGEH